MSGELEAAGALATAGLAAGAIEGRESHGGAHDGKCLNCGAAITGPYCAQCGQASHPHRSLVHVFEEFLHGILHFDTKAWRTLPMVIFRPGTLTRNYVHGKRARYISPLALFLFTIFFMFFVFAFMPHNEEDYAAAPQSVATVEELATARENLAEARAGLAELRASGSEAGGIELGVTENVVSALEAEVRRLERALAEETPAATTPEAPPTAESAPAAEPSPAPASGPQISVSPEAPPEVTEPVEVRVDGEPVTLDANGTWQDRARDIAQSDNFVVVDGWDSFNEKIRRKFENPDLALYKIQQAAYKFSFLLAPLSLPFIALLFLWKRGLTLYDHVVYALYALSFASLLFVGVVLSTQHPWTSWLPGWLIMVGLPVHTFFHLKGAYALGWWSALWRTFFMLIFATIIATIFLILIIVLGLAN
ncbi:DUF3667 domain-containing protein [Vitreimonas flagellata]|uniref:DUF3667 domain-containing protein n=1 Tax=Vitreimonas flagellata TaxID=2560861 RepID=UPI001074C41A|nr:DUF3667 domain-containing protein [Vitreimonas flagellata]